MISQNQILRLIEAREYRQLIERVLSNGRCRSPLARRVLTDSAAAAPAALGLGLQRLSEITYHPTPLSEAIAWELLAMQHEGGLFAVNETAADDATLAATAVAVRALIAFATQRKGSGLNVDGRISDAIERGIATLARQRSQSADIATNAVGWAIVLWQLGDVALFRKQIPIVTLLEGLDDSAAEILEDELCRYAHAMAA